MIQKIIHPLEPVYDAESRVLILGTMPSPRSREAGYYYAHPQNRFWPVLGMILEEAPPADRDGRLAFAHRHHIALWDVLASCEIEGASDSSIHNPVPNDIRSILQQAPIRAVFTTGNTAAKLYRKFIFPVCGIEAIALPSTSPANCRVRMEQLAENYRQILSFLD